MGNGLGEFLWVSAFILFPLALWKVADIIFWIYNHVEIGIK